MLNGIIAKKKVKRNNPENTKKKINTTATTSRNENTMKRQIKVSCRNFDQTQPIDQTAWARTCFTTHAASTVKI